MPLLPRPVMFASRVIPSGEAEASLPVTTPSKAAWLRRPAAVFALVGVVAAAVAAFEYRDQRRAHRDTQQMYQGLVDGLGAVADLQYEIQEARRSMLYALATTDPNRQVEYVDRSRSADARVTIDHQPARVDQ